MHNAQDQLNKKPSREFRTSKAFRRLFVSAEFVLLAVGWYYIGYFYCSYTIIQPLCLLVYNALTASFVLHMKPISIASHEFHSPFL